MDVTAVYTCLNAIGSSRVVDVSCILWPSQSNSTTNDSRVRKNNLCRKVFIINFTSRNFQLYHYGLVTLPFWLYSFLSPILYPLIAIYLVTGNRVLGILVSYPLFDAVSTSLLICQSITAPLQQYLRDLAAL